MNCKYLLAGVLAITAICAARTGRCQSLYLAPTTLEGDRIRFLIAPSVREPLTVEFREYARGDNNVVSLARGNRKNIGPGTFNANSAYLNDYHGTDLSLKHGRWSLGIATTSADLYQGNHDTGQIYLDSLAHTLNFNTPLAPEATMNRSEATRYRVGYVTGLRIGHHDAVLQLAANLLDVKRVQIGTLKGANVGTAFSGNLTILTTLGLPSSDTRSYGLSLDGALSVALAPQWRVGVTVDNLLGQLWQRKLQQLDTSVTTNTVTPDADGFLHGVPLLSGRISYRSPNLDLRRRMDLGTSYTEHNRSWLFMLSDDIDLRAGAGLNISHNQSARFWAVFWAGPFEWQTGFDIANLRFQFGMSTFNADQAKRATVSVTFRVPLGH